MREIIKDLAIYASILFDRIIMTWESDTWIHNFLKVVVAWLFAFWLDVYVYISIVVFLSVADVATGLQRALKDGKRFSSKKLRRGLIERLVLFTSLFVLMLCMDNLIQGFYDYGKYYITQFVCVLIGFYEVTSIIENLIAIYPKYTFLNKIAKFLNLLETKYEERTIDKVEEFLSKNDDTSVSDDSN